jgi:hypothetical protein
MELEPFTRSWSKPISTPQRTMNLAESISEGNRSPLANWRSCYSASSRPTPPIPLPPSANPLGAGKPVHKEKSERRRGGQPNHPPHLKQWLLPERVQHIEHFIPETCAS